MIPVHNNDTDIKSFHDWYLILEDDADFKFHAYKDDFRTYLGNVLRQIPKDADMLYLGCVIPKSSKKKYSKNKMFIRLSYAWQLHAYVLKGSAIEILLNNLPINGPVDNYISSLMYNKLLVGYALSEKIIIQQGIIILLQLLSLFNIYY